MSEQEFESYLRLLGRFLRLSGEQRDAIAGELRDHMEERLEELMGRGFSRDDAIQAALDEFGDAAALAGDFGRIGRRRRWIMRTTMATTGLAAAVLMISFLLPENRAFVPAPSLLQAENSARLLAGAADPETRPAGVEAQQRQQAISGVYASGESEVERETLQRLAVKASEIQFTEGTGLAEVLDFIAQKAGVSLNVNWNALSLVGLDRTTDVGGLNLRDVRIDRALQIVLQSAGSATGTQLEYSITDGIVRISTTEDLDRFVIVRVYDCRDLMKRPEKSERGSGMQPEVAPGMMTPGAGGFGGGMPGGEAFGAAGGMPAPESADSARLRMLLLSTIAPGTWAPEGTTGSVGDYDGLLVVRHTWRVHQSVGELLNLLRRAKAARDFGDSSENVRELSISHPSAEQVIDAAHDEGHEARSIGAAGTQPSVELSRSDRARSR